MNIFKKKKIIVTHNGTFHADDLFACATVSLWLQKNNQPFSIIRTRDPKVIEKADYVFDVGGEYTENNNRFDHHQLKGAGFRDNGIPYASFGLAWKHFGMELCNGDSSVWNLIDRKIASPIDCIDNGFDLIKPIYQDVVPYGGEQPFLINIPAWNEDESDINNIFKSQVKKVTKLLTREIKVANADSVAMQSIIDSYHKSEDKRIIELSDDFPRYLFQEVLSKFQEPIYVISHSRKSGGAWKVEAIRKSPETMKSRKLFPETWRGYMDNDSELSKLREITGVSDATFCHRNGFLMEAYSREGVFALAEKALLA